MSNLSTTDNPNDTQLYKSSSFVVPNSMKFTAPKHGPVGTRKEFRLPSVASTYASSGGDNIVRFRLPNDGIIDVRRGYISFKCAITGSNGTYVRTAQGIWSIFNRVRLTTGKELEDIREYNLLHSFLYEALRDEEVMDVIGPSCYNYAVQADRNLNATTNKTFAMPLMCGFFLTGLIPTGQFKEVVELQLYLDDAFKVLETDSTTKPVITLTNLYIHYEVLKFADNTENKIHGMASAGLQYPYKRFTHYVNTVTSSKNNIVIPHVGAGIETLLSVMRRSDQDSNTAINDKFLTYNKTGCDTHQIRINNNFFPLEPTLCTGDEVQSYIQYLRWAGKWNFGGVYRNPPSIDIGEYNTSKFMIINQLETHPGEGLINPMSTEQAGTNIYIKLDLTDVPANPTRLDTFVQSYAVIDLCGGKLY